nr:MAG: NPH-PPH downregulator [Equine parapoxvirus]
MRNYVSLLSRLARSNRRLGASRVFKDAMQCITATAFVHRRVERPRRVSIGAVLTTDDGLVVACRRRHSFFWSEIADTRSAARRGRLAAKHAAALARAGAARAADDVVFPGGAPLRGESAVDCALREVEEETGIRRADVALDTRLFVHAFIDDLVTGRDFDAVLFTGAVRLTSAEVARRFAPNSEVKGLVFLRPGEGGVVGALAAFAREAARARCWGALRGGRDDVDEPPLADAHHGALA